MKMSKTKTESVLSFRVYNCLFLHLYLIFPKITWICKQKCENSKHHPPNKKQ